MIVMPWTEAHAKAMDDELRKAGHRKVDQWLRELDSRGQVVFRTSIVKVLLFAIGSWAFVVPLVAAFLAIDRSDWLLFGDPSGTARETAQSMFVVLILVVAVLLFGAAAILSTVVVPLARPRTIVTPRDVRYVWSLPWHDGTVFHCLWQDVVAVRVRHTHLRWPVPEMLHLTIEARAAVASRQRGSRRAEGSSGADAANGGATVTGPVIWMPRHHKRDILAFLVALHVRTMRSRQG